jgi:PAS domain S-box-containing protein
LRRRSGANALKNAKLRLVEDTVSQTGANRRHSDAAEASNAIEERLLLIIDTIPTIVWRKLPDGSADFLNRNFREYTGLSSEEGMGWGWMNNAFHSDDRLIEEWRAALAAGKPFEKEARLRRADGKYRWFLVRAVPLRDEQGTIVNWYGTTSDIEDLKRAEDRVRLIIDTLPTMVWTLQPNGAVDFVNQRWMDFTGLSLEEEIENPTGPVHPEDLPRVLEKWFPDFAAGKPSEDELRMRRADGEYRWFLVRTVPLRDERGNILKWYGVSIDIEGRKRAEEAARTSEREQRHIAAQLERERARLVEAQEMAKIGSWETELESLNIIWSEQAHRIFETDPFRFRPTRPKFREFIHPADRAKVDNAFVASLEKRSPSTVEYRIVMPDGRVKILEERWQAFHDEEGKPVRVAGTCRDVTERVRAEEELRRLSGQLLRLQDEERRSIARDLHDSTGQDLVALATTLSQLRASIPSSSRKLRRLTSQCQGLADQCVREVRTLSYLLHPPMLDEAGLEDAIRYYAGGFTERTRIEVEFEISPRLGRMKPDVEMALFRVVQESLTNIQRHSGSPQARIRIERDPRMITLEISDKGGGIPGNLRRQNGKVSFGLGVGIPSMHERVKLIGGRLDIESSSSGTAIRVTIPVDG